MKTKFLIGTDIGTSSTKTIIMDTEGNLVFFSLRRLRSIDAETSSAEQWGDIWRMQQ
jgi:xylulokinase